MNMNQSMASKIFYNIKRFFVTSVIRCEHIFERQQRGVLFMSGDSLLEKAVNALLKDENALK